MVRHDSLKNVTVDRQEDRTFAVLPAGFVLWEGTGTWLQAERLPDGRTAVGVDNDVLAGLVVDVLDEMAQGKGGGDTRASALVLLLAGEDRVQVAAEVTVAAQQAGLL